MEFTGCRGVKGLVYVEDIHFLFRSLKSFNCCLCFITLDLVSMSESSASIKMASAFWRKKRSILVTVKKETQKQKPQNLRNAMHHNALAKSLMPSTTNNINYLI